MKLIYAIAPIGVFTVAADLAIQNALVDGGNLTQNVRVPCSPTGVAPITHMTAQGCLNATQLAAVRAAISGVALTGSKYWVCSEVDGTLLATNNAGSIVGSIFQFQDALNALGLQILPYTI